MNVLLEVLHIYRIAGMFGRVNVWRIAKLKDIGEIKFSELIDFSHKDAIYKLNFGWLVWRTTDDSPNSPNFPAIRYLRMHNRPYNGAQYVIQLVKKGCSSCIHLNDFEEP